MSEQLEAWKGDFGDEYTKRNNDMGTLPARKTFFREALFGVTPKSVLEIGANIGLNLLALRGQFPDVNLWGVEPNRTAGERLQAANFGWSDTIDELCGPFDLVFTCGVLIHVPPEELNEFCTQIWTASNRYILIAEYFSPEPREVEYRGQDGMLWTRDWGSYWLQNSPVNVKRYGFCWKPETGLDNLTWWLMEKAQ